jgi:hypothetical protein
VAVSPGPDFHENFRKCVFLGGVRFPKEFLETCARAKGQGDMAYGSAECVGLSVAAPLGGGANKLSLRNSVKQSESVNPFSHVVCAGARV